MDDEKTPGKIMTVKEVSQYLRLPLSTVYDLTKKGKLRAIKFGRHLRYLETEIQNYFSDRKSSIQERRFHPRMNCELSSRLSLLLPRTSQLIKIGTVQNLSPGGVFFVNEGMEKDLRVGDPVRISFEMDLGEVEADGRVIHLSGAAQEGFGIKFRGIAAEKEKMIRDYVG